MDKTPERRFGIHFSIILRSGQMYLDRELEHLGVRSGQIPILRLLGIRDGINQERIRKTLHLDKGTVAKTIRPLIHNGYVTRKKDPNDKRAYKIFLTPEGREIIDYVKDAVTKWTDALTDGFTEQEKETAHALIVRMSENSRERLKP